MKRALMLKKLDPSPADPVLRLLHLDGDPIAIASVDPSAAEGTVTWPLHPGTNLREVLELWFGVVVPRYGRADAVVRLETWISDGFVSRVLPKGAGWDGVLNELGRRFLSPKDELQLMLLGLPESEDLVFELSFTASVDRGHVFLPDNSLSQAAVSLKQVRLQALVKLFSVFHSHPDVRADGEIGLQSFADSTGQHDEPLGLLNPLTVLRE